MVCEGICSVRVAREGRYSVYVVLLDEHTIWIVDAHRGDGRRFIVHADERLTAFGELERQVLTVTFYLASIRAGDE
jgi:hypothetical protein